MDLVIARSADSLVLRTCNWRERPNPLCGEVVAVLPQMAHHADAIMEAFLHDDRVKRNAPLSNILSVVAGVIAAAPQVSGPPIRG